MRHREEVMEEWQRLRRVWRWAFALWPPSRPMLLVTSLVGVAVLGAIAMWRVAPSTPVLSPSTPASAPKPMCPPPENKLDCTPTRDCSLRVDERVCRVCLLTNLVGGCIQYGNDPACEAGKASQNAIYGAQKAQCDVEKAAEKTSCEATKAAIELRIAECAK